MYMSICLRVYVCVPRACHALRGRKRASYPLGLELQMVQSCHVGARSQTQVLCKSKNMLNHFSSPCNCLFD